MGKSFGPRMNAEERGIADALRSALLGVHRRPIILPARRRPRWLGSDSFTASGGVAARDGTGRRGRSARSGGAPLASAVHFPGARPGPRPDHPIRNCRDTSPAGGLPDVLAARSARRAPPGVRLPGGQSTRLALATRAAGAPPSYCAMIWRDVPVSVSAPAETGRNTGLMAYDTATCTVLPGLLLGVQVTVTVRELGLSGVAYCWAMV